ncbi:Ltp family lipoprotein [Luteimonas qiangzhengi]|uniref:Ltp family lipoprotein n=1 Tax=Luteimonas sp. MJ146 TaxID=3129240 RepID=UPI0031BA6312
MGTEKCKDCGNTVSTSASKCPHCGRQLKHVVTGPRILILALAALLVGMIYSSGKADRAEADRQAKFLQTMQDLGSVGAGGLTGPRGNAIRSANQYLSFQGFSRDGLIEQLSSDYGDGYSVADATAAVDSLTVDWNEQAVRSAQQYLSMQGFSCKGLIEQLSASAGDKYTVSQATHGARQAGAC